jgi:membrane fusion protein (multidrug efflux system)
MAPEQNSGTPSSAPGAAPGGGGPPRPNLAGLQPTPRRSRWRIVIPLGLITLLAVAAVGYWYLKIYGVISTDDAMIDGDRVSLSSKMLGRITTLAADEGDTVRQDELLVQLDDSDLQARRAQAEAGLAAAQANVTLAAVEVRQAEDDFARAKIQAEGKVITAEQYEHARIAVDKAQAMHAVALAQVETARAQLGVIRQELVNTKIVSPLSGVVARRWVLAGDVVQPGQAILSIYDLRDVWVTAYLEETKLGAIALGDSVTISVDAYAGRAFGGEIIIIGAAAASQFSLIPPNNASGNYTKVTQRVPIRVSIHPPAEGDPVLLLPGMSVEITVEPRGRG